MSSQHISDIYEDAVSISQVRRDIGVLLQKLKKEGEVKVLRGQNVLFIAVDPEEFEKQRANQTAKSKIAKYYSKMRQKHKTSLSSFVVRDRERMKKKHYYATGNS